MMIRKIIYLFGRYFRIPKNPMEHMTNINLRKVLDIGKPFTILPNTGGNNQLGLPISRNIGTSLTYSFT